MPHSYALSLRTFAFWVWHGHISAWTRALSSGWRSSMLTSSATLTWTCEVARITGVESLIAGEVGSTTAGGSGSDGNSHSCLIQCVSSWHWPCCDWDRWQWQMSRRVVAVMVIVLKNLVISVAIFVAMVICIVVIIFMIQVGCIVHTAMCYTSCDRQPCPVGF